MKDKPATVFVVDDDAGVRSSIRLLLKSAGIPAGNLSGCSVT